LATAGLVPLTEIGSGVSAIYVTVFVDGDALAVPIDMVTVGFVRLPIGV